MHTVIDDHSRVAYARSTTTRPSRPHPVLRNAVAWFAERGVTVERVLSDNGSCYRSYLWRDTCTELGITPKRTRPYRPQTNGKIERFHRTLAEGWAFKKFYSTRPHARRSASMAPPLQPPPAPHRDRTVSSDVQVDQPQRSVHLAQVEAGLVTEGMRPRQAGPLGWQVASGWLRSTSCLSPARAPDVRRAEEGIRHRPR